MDDVTTRFVSDLIGRSTGPMAFRLVLQPAMAVFFAIRDGVRAARDWAGRRISGAFSPRNGQIGVTSSRKPGRPSSRCSRSPFCSTWSTS